MGLKGKAKAVGDIAGSYYSGIRHLFHRSYTLRFPEQRLVVEKGYRGRHLLHLDRCTGCGICAWICPEKCITIVPRGERWYPQYFYGRCCFCHFCVSADTLVTANPSVKSIGSIQVGDRVLTHTGEYRRVRQVFTRNYTGRLYSIKPLGAPFPLKVTEDHPLLVAPRKPPKKGRVEKKRADMMWKTPAELREGDYLTIPIPKEVRDIDVYSQDVVIGQPSTGKRLVRKLRLKADPDLFRLIGYYLAEGHITKRTLGLTFGEHETEYIADSVQLLEKFFGRRTKLSVVHNSAQVLLHSVVALQFFANFGRGAENKKIPDWVMFAPAAKLRELVSGAFRGDGYFHRPTKYDSRAYYKYVTVSRALAFQLQQILFKLGIVGSMSFRQQRSRKPAYVLAVSGSFVSPMAEVMQAKFGDVRTGSFSHFKIDDDYVYTPIRGITSSLVNDQPVVNLSVEGDESYVAGNVTAHNCTDYCPEYALEETVEFDLAEYSRDRLVWNPERLARPPAGRDDKYVFSVDTPRGASNIPREESKPIPTKKK